MEVPMKVKDALANGTSTCAASQKLVEWHCLLPKLQKRISLGLFRARDTMLMSRATCSGSNPPPLATVNVRSSCATDLSLYKAAYAVGLGFKRQVKKIRDDQYACEHDEIDTQATEIVGRQVPIA